MNRLPLILFVLLISCSERPDRTIDIQGHRGARGLVAENSLPAFLLATQLGVNTLELDLVVSRDSLLIVSHEPYISPHFCFDQSGNEIPEDSVINMYQLNYDQIKQFDCGSKGNSRFPTQELMTTYKPLLETVIDSIEVYVAENNLQPMRYNLELKTLRETDTIFHPTPERFSELVYTLLATKEVLDRVTIQSFDFRTLVYFHANYPDVDLALLIENDLSWRDNIDSLGFSPQIYSCYYELLSRESVSEIQAANMAVIPWTVNEISDMERILSWGVDGIITDYPDRALKVIQKR